MRAIELRNGLMRDNRVAGGGDAWLPVCFQWKAND
jgi:hypothetical protein